MTEDPRTGRSFPLGARALLARFDGAIADPDPTVLEREIESKVTMARQGGGYIMSSDHSIPENVPLERYQWMVALGRKYGAFG